MHINRFKNKMMRTKDEKEEVLNADDDDDDDEKNQTTICRCEWANVNCNRFKPNRQTTNKHKKAVRYIQPKHREKDLTNVARAHD